MSQYSKKKNAEGNRVTTYEQYQQALAGEWRNGDIVGAQESELSPRRSARIDLYEMQEGYSGRKRISFFYTNWKRIWDKLYDLPEPILPDGSKYCRNISLNNTTAQLIDYEEAYPDMDLYECLCEDAITVMFIEDHTSKVTSRMKLGIPKNQSSLLHCQPAYLVVGPSPETMIQRIRDGEVAGIAMARFLVGSYTHHMSSEQLLTNGYGVAMNAIKPFIFSGKEVYCLQGEKRYICEDNFAQVIREARVLQIHDKPMFPIHGVVGGVDDEPMCLPSFSKIMSRAAEGECARDRKYRSLLYRLTYLREQFLDYMVELTILLEKKHGEGLIDDVFSYKDAYGGIYTETNPCDEIPIDGFSDNDLGRYLHERKKIMEVFDYLVAKADEKSEEIDKEWEELNDTSL